MADLLFIGMMIVFFGLTVALVRLCDRIIGTDESVVIGTVEFADQADEVEKAAA